MPVNIFNSGHTDQVPFPIEDNSRDSLILKGGLVAKSVKVLNANNQSAILNIFQVTGSVEIIKLYAEVTAVTTLSNCTSVYFDLYDGENSPLITANTGVISGALLGSFFYKDGDAAANIALLNANQTRVGHSSNGKKDFFPCILTQKSTTNTYVRFRYTTTDTPINATVTFYVEYIPIGNGSLAAV